MAIFTFVDVFGKPVSIVGVYRGLISRLGSKGLSKFDCTGLLRPGFVYKVSPAGNSNLNASASIFMRVIQSILCLSFLIKTGELIHQVPFSRNNPSFGTAFSCSPYNALILSAIFSL